MNLSQNRDITASIDWLEFTIMGLSVDDTLKEILEIHPAEFTPLKKGRFGYKNQSKWADGNVFIMFNQPELNMEQETLDEDRMGVHIMLTGSGCRQYAVQHQLKKLMLYLTVLGEKVNVTRIDLAIDDFTDELVCFDRIHQAALNKHFTSRWNKWDEVNSRQSATGEYLGRTIYFGSQTSSIFCRIYDKGLERKVNGDRDAKYPENWTRLEIIYRKERAKLLIYHLIDKQIPIGEAVRGTLNQYIRFLTPSSDSNKARWPSATWWNQLLNGVSKLKLTIQKEEKSIDDMTDWVDRQIAPTIAAILTAKEGDLAWLHEIINKGAQRLSQRHREAIAQYQKEIAI